MRKPRTTCWTLLFAASTIGFALTAHRDEWLLWRCLSLALASVALCGGWVTADDPVKTTLGRCQSHYRLAWIAVAVALAVAAAARYRFLIGQSIFPTTLHAFAFFAMAIGCTEELLWRGWMQGTLIEPLGPFHATLLAAGSHTAYKTALFLFPPPGITFFPLVSFLFMASCTFGAGVVLGYLRTREGTIVPPVAFHVVFDLFVYCQYTSTPWWFF